MAGVEVAKMKKDTYYVSFPEVFVASAGVHVSQEGCESSQSTSWAHAHVLMVPLTGCEFRRVT